IRIVRRGRVLDICFDYGDIDLRIHHFQNLPNSRRISDADSALSRPIGVQSCGSRSGDLEGGCGITKYWDTSNQGGNDQPSPAPAFFQILSLVQHIKSKLADSLTPD